MTQDSRDPSPGVRTLNVFGKSQADEMKTAQGKGNEDFIYPPRPADMRRSSLFVVGDFMATTFPNVGEQAVYSIDRILRRAAPLPPRHLLCQLANELDKAMKNASQGGRHAVEFTMAAGVIGGGNLLYYLTIGDCGINVYREGRLHLLNGSSWAVGSMTVEPTDEVDRGTQPAQWPPSRALKCGRGMTFVQPRDVEVFQLEEGDIVLFFSDGVERNLTPADRLKLVGESQALPPEEFAESLVSRTLSEARQRGGGDDCTLLVAAGPFGPVPSEEVERMKSDFRSSLQQIESLIKASGETLLRMEASAAGQSQLDGLNGALAQLQEAVRKLEAVPGQLQGLAADVSRIIPKVDERGQEIRQLTEGLSTLNEVRAGVDGLLNTALKKNDIAAELSGHNHQLGTLQAIITERMNSDRSGAAPARAQDLQALSVVVEGVRASLSRLGDLANKSDISELLDAALQSAQTQSWQGDVGKEDGTARGAAASEEAHTLESHLAQLEANIVDRLTQVVNDGVSDIQSNVNPPKMSLPPPTVETPDVTPATGGIGKGPGEAREDVAVPVAAGAGVGGTQAEVRALPAATPKLFKADPVNADVTPDAARGSKLRHFLKTLADSRWRPLITHAAAVLITASVMFLVFRNQSAGTNPTVNANVGNVNANADNVGGGVNSPASAEYKIALRPDGWTLVTIGPDNVEKPLKLYAHPASFPRDKMPLTFGSEEEVNGQLSAWQKTWPTTPEALKAELLKVEPFKSSSNLRVYKLPADEVKKAREQGAGGNICTWLVSVWGMTPQDWQLLNPWQSDCSGLDAGDIVVGGKVKNRESGIMSARPTPTPLRPTPTPPQPTPTPPRPTDAEPPKLLVAESSNSLSSGVDRKEQM